MKQQDKAKPFLFQSDDFILRKKQMTVNSNMESDQLFSLLRMRNFRAIFERRTLRTLEEACPKKRSYGRY
jgi:hypothetical protein